MERVQGFIDRAKTPVTQYAAGITDELLPHRTTKANPPVAYGHGVIGARKAKAALTRALQQQIERRFGWD